MTFMSLVILLVTVLVAVPALAPVMGRDTRRAELLRELANHH
jgi:hypothetical protein